MPVNNIKKDPVVEVLELTPGRFYRRDVPCNGQEDLEFLRIASTLCAIHSHCSA